MAVIGVDVGTQSLKAVLCDDALTVLATASRSYPYQVPRPGWAEQDPAVWIEALEVCVAEVLEVAHESGAAIGAIGVAGQLDGCVPVDTRGRALGPALIWMDRRAAASMPVLHPDAFLEQTGQVADPSHMAAKIRWLKQDGAAAARFHQPVSFVVEALTGASVFDRAHASTTMLYDQIAGAYDVELLASFEIEVGELPDIGAASDVAGELSRAIGGLPAGVPVCVGTGDDFATPLGAGIIDPGVLACVLGTAEVVGVVTPDRVLDRGRLLETHDYVGGRFFLENPGWLAGGSIRWAQSLLGLEHPADLDALAASSVPGARGVSFVPALGGAMAPRWEPGARGCLGGLSAATSRADVARAVLEGCAFAMNDVIRRVDALGLVVGEIALLGGGSRSLLWRQIRADVARLPLRAADSVDTCAVGAAALAAISVGAIESIESAATLVSRFGPPCEPRRENAGAYEDAYQRYLSLFEGVASLAVRS